ncbi:hypothetical protein ASPFODRAFT_572951 [Aspergillus luchuensis CBS 106.47]|uniref:Uncharacterized protein n=1 Tax=Aspergillus luchuensis (strain CBS 106.47) TaxID=1137211 RepID=A0A1M3TKW3_ASPLC|nr:hypothetical protein ASPFODRAFT_572951 [Aspergillus luchuensis CBS 106.47]
MSQRTLINFLHKEKFFIDTGGNLHQSEIQYKRASCHPLQVKIIPVGQKTSEDGNSLQGAIPYRALVTPTINMKREWKSTCRHGTVTLLIVNLAVYLRMMVLLGEQ